MAIDERALTCKELGELVTDYLEDSLSLEIKERFDAHLANCADCTANLQQMRNAIQALGNLREDSLSPQARENLLRLFRKWKSTD